MAYPSASCRVALQGTVSNGEIFETTFGGLDCLVGSAADANTLATRIAVHWLADMQSVVQTMITTDMSYTSVKVYVYPTGGSTATFIGVAPLATVGTGTNIGPLQAAVVATLNTGFAGRRRRGRMYFPNTALAYQAGHFVTATFAPLLANALATFFRDVAADLTFSITPAVISTTSSSGEPITQISVNSKPDIQRRRANRQGNGTTSVVAI